MLIKNITLTFSDLIYIINAFMRHYRYSIESVTPCSFQLSTALNIKILKTQILNSEISRLNIALLKTEMY